MLISLVTYPQTQNAVSILYNVRVIKVAIRAQIDLQSTDSHELQSNVKAKRKRG